MCGHPNVALGLDVGGLRVLTITRSLMSVDSISFSWGCAPGHGQSNGGLAECLAEVSCLREVVKKLAANVMWSTGALHLSSNVDLVSQLKLILVACT